MSSREEKKQKKLAQILKARRFQQINQLDAIHARERDREKEREEAIRESGRKSSRSAEKKKQQAQPVWSARMQEIRNKLDGRKRMADERWNRFAGTEGGGARGL